MKKFVTITTLVALTMGGAACSSHDRVVKENTERSYSSTMASPTPPPVQEHSYRTEERSSSTSDPFAPQEQTMSRSRVEERSSTAVPPPEVQQRTTIERRSSTVTSD
jgi:hypothetical protein